MRWVSWDKMTREEGHVIKAGCGGGGEIKKIYIEMQVRVKQD